MISLVNKKTVPVKIDGKVVGSADIDLDDLEGPITGRIDDPELAKKIFNERLPELSIYSGNPMDEGLYGEGMDGTIL